MFPCQYKLWSFVAEESALQPRKQARNVRRRESPVEQHIPSPPSYQSRVAASPSSHAPSTQTGEDSDIEHETLPLEFEGMTLGEGMAVLIKLMKEQKAIQLQTRRSKYYMHTFSHITSILIFKK
ncbi:uncharacterized protein PAE49_010928 [Odontesthes bonariensis]